MSGGRNYSAGTREALFMLSRGYCYEPTCKKRVMTWTGKKWEIDVFIAHIYGVKGPRHIEGMDEKELNNFANLLLLCKEHHNLVDVRPTRDQYPPEILLEWKSIREEGMADELNKLDWINQERLQELMADAVTDTKEEIIQAVDKVTGISEETLAILKGLVTDSFVMPYLDSQSIASLEYSATVFQDLPDHIPLLHQSARDLRDLPDHSILLHDSARDLRDLPDYALILNESARLLHGLEDKAEILSCAASELRALEPQISALQGIIDLADSLRGVHQMEYVATSIADSSSSLNRAMETIGTMDRVAENLAFAASKVPTARRWSWREFGYGALTCAIFVVAILYLWAHATGKKGQ